MKTLINSSLVDPRVGKLKISPTLKTLEVACNLQAEGVNITRWGLGENPLPRPRCLTQAMLSNIEDKRYTSTQGYPGLSQVIASYISTKGYQIDEKNVVVAPGVKQLLFNLQMSFGGEIIHVVPYWVSYNEQTVALGKDVILIKTSQENKFKLTPNDLSSLKGGSPRLLIFNNPTNPTGLVYSEEELQDLALYFKELGIIVASDEIYLGNSYVDSKRSIATFLPDATIRLRGLSKEYSCGGDRIGYASFPNSLSWLCEAMHNLGSSTYSCAPVVQQHALQRALEGGVEIDNYLKRSRLIFSTIGQKCAEEFRRLKIGCETPEAAWYIWLDFSFYKENFNVTSNDELVSLILKETGLIFVSGSSFGMEKESLIIRGSFVDFNGTEALLNAEAYLSGHLPEQEWLSPWSDSIFSSIERLGDWLLSL